MTGDDSDDSDSLGPRCIYSGKSPGYKGHNCVECATLEHDYDKKCSEDGRHACTGFTIHESTVARQIRLASRLVNRAGPKMKDVAMSLGDGLAGHVSVLDRSEEDSETSVAM
jgi:hypothetical protein